jgi:hypothetical protein
VSLLERLGRGHLDDRQFARIWTNGGGDPHLDVCATCRARFNAFDHWVLGLGEELREEADHLLTPERLAAQQAQIARRLEGLERPARVIAFPKAARAVIGGHSHVRRWVTVAAAAGLIAGIGLGQIVDLRHSLDATRTATPNIVAENNKRPDAPPLRASAVSLRDNEFLSDPEAFAQPGVAALVPLEDLTPHARDLVERPR